MGIHVCVYIYATFTNDDVLSWKNGTGKGREEQEEDPVWVEEKKRGHRKEKKREREMQW